MTKLYCIVPAVLLLAFAFVYRSAEAGRTARHQAFKTKLAVIEKEKETVRLNAAARTAEETKLKQAERAQQEAEKVEKKQREHAAAIAVLLNQAVPLETAARNYAQEADGLTTRLATLRAERPRLERETFALEQEVERARVERRSADVEIQRTAQLAATRLNDRADAKPAPLLQHGTSAPERRKP